MARYVRKLIAALLMVTALIVTQIPAVDVDAARVDVGDYTMDGDTLVKYNGTETSVTVPNSVRTIGHEAFSGNSTMTEVVIPDRVTNVEFSSFENCINLQKVTMGSNVKTIGAAAFSGCTSLKSISIPAKTSEIGAGAFAKCSSLSNIPVNYQNQNYTCESGVLYNQDQTQLIQYLAGKPSTSYIMPDTVEKISVYAFWGADQLTGVTISPRVKEIPEYAFSNCNGLSTVTIPSSVESLQAYSFGDCVNLSKIYIPKSVGYIDEDAFASSNNVNIQFVDGNGNPDGQPSQTVSGNTVGTDAVSDSFSLYDTVDFSDNVMPGELGSGKIVGGGVVVMMSSDQAVRGADMGLAESEDGIASSGSYGTYNAGDYEILAGTLAAYLGSESDVALPVNVSRVGERSFYKNENLNTVTLPSRVTSIGDFAFARSGLSSVNIPEGVTDLGYAAFYHCNNLSDVTIPSTLSHIDLGAFEGTPWLNQWKSNGGDGNDFLIVGDGILLAYRGTGGEVVIPDGVKTIGAECFKGNSTISQITIPEGVTEIGEDACNGCSMLYSVNLPQSLMKLEDRAFADCPFQQVRIPQGVQEIGLGAFDATAIGSPMQTVILEGSTLPHVTYNTTATRLSGANLRKLAFEGIGKVILRQDAEVTSGSVLDPNYYGFRGLIYKITGEPTDTSTGTLELQSCTILPNPSTGQVSIDPHATVDGKEYIMTGVKASAFNPYNTVETWSGLRLTGIQIQGNASDSLKNLISQIVFSDAGGAVNAVRTAEDSIFVHSTKAGMEDTSKISAVIPDSTNSYMLMIADGEDTAARVSQALSAQYSAIGGITSYPMEMQLYDSLAMIPITKLATNKMEICMPVPALFTNTDGLEVGAVNANGTLDRLASEITDVGGTPCIKFVASHFSPYVIYRLPDSPTDGTASISKSMSTAASSSAEYVVRTLTKGTGRIQPKWCLAGILALLSILLFWFKSKKKS